MSSLKWKMAAITVGAAVLAVAGAAPARTAAASSQVAATDICLQSDPVHASTDFQDSSGGAYVWGNLCEDHVSGGWYWSVYVWDFGDGDGKSAHAVADWYHKNGNHYYDYGMWVCGPDSGGVWFKTPTRNPTLYQETGLGAFVDNGPIAWGAYVRTA
ncbi:MAG TPA: hypothetical protein VGD71_15165 [Kribbella sp.]|jgi:hypothetical protein